MNYSSDFCHQFLFLPLFNGSVQSLVVYVSICWISIICIVWHITAKHLRPVTLITAKQGQSRRHSRRCRKRRDQLSSDTERSVWHLVCCHIVFPGSLFYLLHLILLSCYLAGIWATLFSISNWPVGTVSQQNKLIDWIYLLLSWLHRQHKNAKLWYIVHFNGV